MPAPFALWYFPDGWVSWGVVVVQRRRVIPIVAALVVGCAVTTPVDAAAPASIVGCDRDAPSPDAVIEACTVALQDSALKAPARAHLLVIRGQREASSGKSKAAISDFSEVIELDTKQTQAMNAAAKHGPSGFAQLGNSAEDYVALLNADMAMAYANRGIALRRQGELDGAIADLSNALKLAPNFPQILVARATAWRLKGRPDLALRDLDDAIHASPTDAAALVSRGRIYSDQGDNDRAIADFNNAIRLAPKLYNAYLDRSSARSDMHDYKGAMADLDSAMALSPNNPSTFFDRAILFSVTGEIEKAAADYTTVIDLYATGHAGTADYQPGDAARAVAQAVAGRAQAYAELGKFAEAEADADRALQLDPTLYFTWIARCNVRAFGNVELELALADCDHAIQLAHSKGETANAFDSRALVRYRQGQFDLAVADENAAIAGDAGEPGFRYLRGLAEERIGKAAEGQADIAAALAADPKLAARYARLGLRAD